MNETDLCKILNYQFQNIELLKQALTRQSGITEKVPGAGSRTYQRLEFLGDSIIRMVVSELIFKIFPEKSECDMSNLRCSYEKNEFIGKIAKDLLVGKYIKIGKGEEKQNLRENTKMLADVFEAIIGAIYIDSDNFITTKNIVLNIYKSSLLQEKMIQENQNRLDLFYNDLNFKVVIHNHLHSYDVAPGPSFEILSKPNSFSKAILQLLEGNDDVSFRKFITKACNIILIDYEINDISSNFLHLITSENIKSYLYFLSKFVKEYYYSFNIKSHYICSKILLSFLTLSHHTPNQFISFTTIFGLTHSGISEFFRKNFEKAKEYFDFAINIIKEQHLFHPETNLLIYYFYSEINNNQNIDYFLNLIESDNSIKAFLNSEETCYTVHGNSILFMMKTKSLANKLIDSNDRLSLCKLYDDLLEKLRHLSLSIPNLF